MRNLGVVSAVLIASLAVGVRAQTASDPASGSPDGTATRGTPAPPKWGIFAGYSSIETNNHNFHFAPDITVSALDYDENSHGFEIGGVRNLTRYLGIVGLFDAHFSSNSFTLGVVPVGGNQFTLVPNCSQSPCTPQGLPSIPACSDSPRGPRSLFATGRV
jgi:hypothetical protein